MKGKLGETKDSRFNGIVPNKVVPAFVDHEALNGDLKKSV